MKDKPKGGMNMKSGMSMKKKPMKREKHMDEKDDKKLMRKMVKKGCMK